MGQRLTDVSVSLPPPFPVSAQIRVMLASSDLACLLLPTGCKAGVFSMTDRGFGHFTQSSLMTYCQSASAERDEIHL